MLVWAKEFMECSYAQSSLVTGTCSYGVRVFPGIVNINVAQQVREMMIYLAVMSWQQTTFMVKLERLRTIPYLDEYTSSHVLLSSKPRTCRYSDYLDGSWRLSRGVVDVDQ